MSLIARNTSGVPIILVAPSLPVVEVPPNSFLNITGEFRGLTPLQFTALEIQRAGLGGVLTFRWVGPDEFSVSPLAVQDPWESLHQGTLIQRSQFHPSDSDWWYVTSGPQAKSLWFYVLGEGWRFVLSGDDLADVQSQLAAPAQTLDVAKSGAAYSSVKAACDYIAGLGDSGPNKPYLVRVYSGVYDEDPFVPPPYVEIVGTGSWSGVVLRTTDNANHFITMSPGSALRQIHLRGPTGTGKAAVRANHTGTYPSFLDNVVIDRGYYGLLCDPAAFGTVHCHGVTNAPSGVAFEHFIHVEGHGYVTALQCSFMEIGGAGASIVYYASGPDAELKLDVCSSLTANPADALFADDGAEVRANACTFETDAAGAGGNAIHVGATPAATLVDAVDCTILGDWTYDVNVEGAGPDVTFMGRARRAYLRAPAGNLAANITDSGGVKVSGELWLGTQNIPMLEYTTAHRDAGTTSGFAVSRGAGVRELVVGPGVGWVEDAIGEIKRIAFAGGSITIPANTDWTHVYVDGTTGLLASSLFEPSARRNLVVADASTDAASIVLVAVDKIATDNASGDDFEYKTRVVQCVWDSGGTVAQVADPGLNLSCTDTTFYVHQRRATAPGTSGNAITKWVVWHRGPGGVGWVKTVVTGALPAGAQMDTGWWDNAGVQTALVAGQFTGHLLIVLVNDEGVEYHMVRGQEIQAAPNLVVNNPVPPEVLQYEACRLARIVVEGGAVDIAAIYDARRTLIGGVGSSTPVVTGDHGALLGLGDDDHPQYQLRSEKGFAGGYAGLDVAAKIPSSLLYLAVAGGQTVAVGASTPGLGPNVALEDHNHSVLTGAPNDIIPGQANAPGVDPAVARKDHDHGFPGFGVLAGTLCEGNDIRLSNARTPTTHGSSHVTGGGDTIPDAVSGGNSGLLSGADKAWIDSLPLSVPPDTRIIGSGAGLIGGGDLTADRTLAVGANLDGSIVVNANDIQVGVLATDAQHGSRGGGTQHTTAVAGGDAGFLSGADKTKLDGLPSSAVPSSRQVVAGAGLIGGGDLSVDRTLNIAAHVDGSIVVNSDDIQVGILATDAQHGARGGGTLHADVVSGGASGFMRGVDKAKLDGLPASAPPTTRAIVSGAGLTGGGDFSSDRTLNIGANPDGSIVVNADDIQIGILASDNQHGNRGGGTLHALAVAAGNAGFLSGSDKAKIDGLPSSVPPTTRSIAAGAGLTGGGDFSADRTLNIGANPDGSIVVNADDVRVGVLATDAQHGTRGGGTLHALAVASGNAGFLSGSDKAKLDSITSPTFGQNPAVASDIPRTTNGTGSFVAKVTMVTPALTGLYRVGWGAVVDLSVTNQNIEVQLQDGGSIVGALQIIRPTNTGERKPCGNVEFITFTGASKTLTLQYRGSGGTAGIADAHIELHRWS